MVLGVLSVMVIMAVAFAVSMRTERVAAGNYADSVRARQLVQVGLARAMADLAGKLGTNGLMSAVGGTNYPPWAVTNSFTNTYTNTSANLYLVYATNGSMRANEATNFVPRALWAAVTNADYRVASNHWLLLDSLMYTNFGITPYVVESNRMGRVKYLILNCSGLLDANFAGGTDRGVGTNPTEIAIGNLGEIGGKLISFLTDRNANVRYETLEELNTLADFYKPATNLFVYSRALPGYWKTNVNPALNCVGTQVNLSGSAANLTNRMSEITNAFARAGFSQFESGVLYSNLIDHVDSDSIPSNFEYCVESVPMINEVLITYNVTVAAPVPFTTPQAYNYTISGNVAIECWYPFVKTASEAFQLNSAVSFAGASAFQGPGPFSLGAHDDSLGTPSSSTFSQVNRPFSTTANNRLPPADLISTLTLVVRRATAPFDDVDQVNITITNYHSGTTISNTSADIECLDPRFNLNSGSTYQWQYMGNTNSSIGFSNTWTKSFLSLANDGDCAMFVSNGPLRSVAELGYLVYSPSEPWKTVKLYGSTCHRVLDVFGLSTNTSDVLMTNTVYRGLVNCNSNSALDATTVVFADMPVDQYPGQGSSPLPMPDARAFVSRLFARGICTNLSDIGYNLNSADFQFPAGMNELQREAYFRNAFNLLNLRQNLFTVIIEAQVASGGNIPRNPVKQRAVALVWRDPYTGEMFVRSIKWLKD